MYRTTLVYTYRPTGADSRREASYTLSRSRPTTHRQGQRILDREIVGVADATLIRVDEIQYDNA